MIAEDETLAFETLRDGPLELLLRADLIKELLPVMRQAPDGFSGMPTRPIAGGRGASVGVPFSGGELVVRAGRRGGLPGKLLAESYIGRRPRCFREIEVIAALFAAGVPVVEPMAAVAQWIGPWRYRSWLATRRLDGAETLWAWLRDHRGAADRKAVLTSAGRTIAALHRVGGHHPDLNANNLLVTRSADATYAVHLIDFDRARRHGPADAAQRDLARLRRSFRKLDAAAESVADDEIDFLIGAHREALG